MAYALAADTRKQDTCATLYETAAAFPTISLFAYRQRWLTVPRPRHGTTQARCTIRNRQRPFLPRAKAREQVRRLPRMLGCDRPERLLPYPLGHWKHNGDPCTLEPTPRRLEPNRPRQGFRPCPASVFADVEFRVSEKSRQRVVKAHCREVHAWAIGERVDTASHGELVAISYNSFRSGSFVRLDNGAAITHADFAIFQPGKRAFAINPS